MRLSTRIVSSPGDGNWPQWTLTARFPSGKYEIGVSLFQAVVLLQFNEDSTLEFKELRDRTGIETTELVRTLQSLALGRRGTRVLVKKPVGKRSESDRCIRMEQDVHF